MVTYDAFISYSHAQDKSVATALQSVVQKLGKPWYRRRSLRLFRDDTSLSASPHLWDSIEEALGRSRYLILLASPQAAASSWVAREIAGWLENKSPESLLIGLTEGTLRWDHEAGDFLWSEETPLPPPLRRRFPTDPRWIDLRPYRKGTSTRDRKFIEAGADFAAALHGRPKEDLLSQEVRQQRRALTLAWSTAAGLLVLVGLASWQSQVAEHARRAAVAAEVVAKQQREVAQVQRSEAQRQRNNMISQLAAVEQLGGDLDRALRLSIHSARLDLGMPGRAASTPLVGAQLAASVSQSAWRLMLAGHEGFVLSANFNPDGQRIVTGSADKTARVWDATTGKELIVLRGHEGGVKSAAFSPDGSRIVTASDDSTARLWDAATGTELAVLRPPEREEISSRPDGPPVVVHTRSAMSSAAFSPDGLRVVTGSIDKTVRVWDSETGKELLVLRDESYVLSAAFSPDGLRIVITGSDDNTARVWDAANGKEIVALRGHAGRVRSAVFSSDGSRIITTSDDSTARVWDATSGNERLVLQGPEGIVSATFRPDGSQIITASARDRTARVWDSETGKELAALRGHAGDLRSAAFSPDGLRIVTGSQDKTARVWDATAGKESVALRGHKDGVASAAFSPDGSRIVTASDDRTARVWDATTGKELVELRGRRVSVPKFSFDGLRIVGFDEGTVWVWDAVTGDRLYGVEDDGSDVIWVNWSRDGLRLIGHPKRILDSARKERVVLDKIGVVDLLVLGGGNLPADFSPDGSRVIAVTGFEKTARLWDGATGKELAVLRGHEDVGSVAFSPDGLLIVTGSGDRSARVWDANTGGELVVLRSDDDVVYVGFSPDGSRIVTGSNDRTARVWDTATGRELAALRGHEGGVKSAAFSPDGVRIVTGSSDKTARVWDVRYAMMATGNLIIEACRRRLRGLSVLSLEEMRLIGEPDDKSRIDVCEGIE
jgi:WD40 repeat protein